MVVAPEDPKDAPFSQHTDEVQQDVREYMYHKLCLVDAGLRLKRKDASCPGKLIEAAQTEPEWVDVECLRVSATDTAWHADTLSSIVWLLTYLILMLVARQENQMVFT